MGSNTDFIRFLDTYMCTQGNIGHMLGDSGDHQCLLYLTEEKKQLLAHVFVQGT